MTVKPKKYGRDQDFDGNNILNSNLNCDWIGGIFADIAIDAGQVYFINVHARDTITLLNAALKSDTGTITATFAINGTPVTGLTSIDATNTKTDYTATAANTVDIGDEITIEIAALADTPTSLSWDLYFKRT